MKVCACFLLFTIFALTNTTAQKDPENPNLHLSWESFLGFDTKHKKYNFKFLDDVNDFISEVKFAVITNKHPTRVGVKRKDNQDDIDRNNIAKNTEYDDEDKKSRQSQGLNASKVFGDTIKFSLEYQPYEPEDDNNKPTTKSRKLSKAFDEKDNNKNMNKSHKDTYGLKPRADDDEKQKRAIDLERSIEEDSLKHDEKYNEDQPKPKDEKAKLSSEEDLPTGSTEGKYKELLHNVEKKYQKYDEERPMPKDEKVNLRKPKDPRGSYESMYEKQLESVIPGLIVNAPSSPITTTSKKSMFTPPPSLSNGGHKQLKPDRLLRPMGREEPLETDTPTEKSPSPTPSSSHWFITAKHAEPNKQTKPKVETNKDKDSQEGLWASQTTSTESEEKTMRRDTKTSEAKKKPEKVHNVLKRINELEKELTDVKNELGNIKIKKELRTQKQMIDFGWTIDTRNAQKSGRKSLLTKGENSNKMDNENAKFKYQKRNNSDNLTDKIDTYDSDFDSNKVSKRKETFATQTNFIFRVNSGTRATKGMKLMIEDLDYVNPKDPRLRNDYEGIDEWKALKFARIDTRTPFKFTTVRTAKSTVKPSTSTTVKPVLISSKSPAVSTSTVKSVLTSSKSPVVQRASDSIVKEKTTSILNDDVIKVSTPTKKVVTEININMTDVNIVDFML
nr:myb-like protein V [Helicoverpa armigera]